ncbi:hypothetical protein AB1K39_09980 [Vibrio cholerae]|uniref:hypothetical protein n=1 Tax=Vibrio cholerae TaxID=666 RepID=UPI003453021D
MRIEISTMKGEIPRLESHLLPNEAASLAFDCTYERGVVAPMRSDQEHGTLATLSPVTLFYYAHSHWFTFTQRVSVIANPMAQDAYQRVYWTGQGKPKVTAQDIAVTQGQMPAAWYDLGVPRPMGKPVLIEKPGSTVTVQLAPMSVNTHNITHTRLYRSVSASGVGDYLLVAELPISQTEYLDSARNVNGPPIETWDYDMPDANMQGLCTMANGICAGFAGNEVMFSEAYLPYAWSKSHRGVTDDDIVAIAPIETSLVVVTKGKPYLFSGVTPSMVTSIRLNVEQACVSAPSLVVINGMAMYASPDGLVAISGTSAIVITEGIMDRESWQNFMPTTIKAWVAEGQYIAQYQGGAFIFDPSTHSLTRLSNTWDSAFHYLHDDTLFIAKGNTLNAWQRGHQPVAMTWQTKAFLIPQHAFLTCARLEAKAPERLRVTVIVDGEAIFKLEQGELTHAPFRFPAVRGSRWQIKVEGTSQVERIVMADSLSELY